MIGLNSFKLKMKISGFDEITNTGDSDLQNNILKKMIDVMTDKKHKSDFEMCDYCNRTMNEALLNIVYTSPYAKIDKQLFTKLCSTLS